MSLSVGVTCGIATQLMFHGWNAFITPEVLAPYSANIYNVIRNMLELEGVKMVENVL